MSERIGLLVSPELVSTLDSLFPNRHPTLSMTDREIWIAVGQRQVVELLKAKHLEAQDNMLED